MRQSPLNVAQAQLGPRVVTDEEGRVTMPAMLQNQGFAYLFKKMPEGMYMPETKYIEFANKIIFEEESPLYVYEKEIDVDVSGGRQTVVLNRMKMGGTHRRKMVTFYAELSKDDERNPHAEREWTEARGGAYQDGDVVGVVTCNTWMDHHGRDNFFVQEVNVRRAFQGSETNEQSSKLGTFLTYLCFQYFRTMAAEATMPVRNSKGFNVRILNMGGIGGSIAYARAALWAGANVMVSHFRRTKVLSSCSFCYGPSAAQIAESPILKFVSVHGAEKRRLTDDEVKDFVVSLWQRLPVEHTKISMYQRHILKMHSDTIPASELYSQGIIFVFEGALKAPSSSDGLGMGMTGQRMIVVPPSGTG
eukprot:g1765.t1